MAMNWVDFSIFGSVAVSAFISVIRGVAREAGALVVGGAAFWLALRDGPARAGGLSAYIDTVAARMVVAFVSLFLAVFAVGTLVSYGLSRAVKRVGLGSADRVLGVVFGITRGALVIALVLMVAGLTPRTDTEAWRGSLVIGYVSPWLPHWQQWLPGEGPQAGLSV